LFVFRLAAIGRITPVEAFEKVCSLDSFAERFLWIGPDEAVRMRVKLCHDSRLRRHDRKAETISCYQICGKRGQVKQQAEIKNSVEGSRKVHDWAILSPSSNFRNPYLNCLRFREPAQDAQTGYDKSRGSDAL